MKSKRTVTIEFDRVKITTARGNKNFFRCEFCQTETEFLSQSETAEIAKVMQMQGLEINRANLHFYQPNEERILVCLNSIIPGNNPETNKYINQEKI